MSLQQINCFTILFNSTFHMYYHMLEVREVQNRFDLYGLIGVCLDSESEQMLDQASQSCSGIADE